MKELSLILLRDVVNKTFTLLKRPQIQLFKNITKNDMTTCISVLIN